MRLSALFPLFLTLPQVARADCIYDGRKGAYVHCVYNELQALSADYADHLLSFFSLQTDVGTTQTDIAALAGQVSTVESDLSAVEGSVSLLQSDVSTLGSRADATDVSVADLLARVEALEGSVSTLQTELSDAQAQIAAHETTIDGLLSGGSGVYSVYVEKNDGTPSVVTETGDWVASTALTGNGTRVTFEAGTFASIPHCVCTSLHFAGVQHMACDINNPSSTTVDVFTAGLDGTQRHRDFWLICMIP